ncbi:MAG: TetR family transcriptional regulator [Firmicutes bacterium]|nr:TetR family transcriptional regulator [Bacillota bacterium]
MEYKEIKFNKTVKSLYNAIIKLVAENHVKDITIEMILQEAEVAKQTFYNYFEDKYALINYVYYHDTKHIWPDLAKSKEVHMQKCAEMLTCLQTKASYYQKVLEYEGQNSFADFYRHYGYNYWKNCLINFYGKEFYDAQLEHSIFIFNRGCAEGTIEWLRNGAVGITPAEKSEIAYNTFPEALKKMIDAPDKEPYIV